MLFLGIYYGFGRKKYLAAYDKKHKEEEKEKLKHINDQIVKERKWISAKENSDYFLPQTTDN